MSAPRRSVVLGGVAVVGVVGLGLASLSGRPPAPVAPAAVEPPPGRVRVEVLNGGGVTGMAREATGYLRDVGFDVVDLGNADRFDPDRPSAVIDRVGRPDLASDVAAALGIDIVLSEPDPNLYVDVSVLLGSEWSSPLANLGRGDGSDTAPWWDPRGWMRR